MKKYLFSLLVAALFCHFSFGQVVVKSYPFAANGANPYDVATDPMGNIVVVGNLGSVSGLLNDPSAPLRKLDPAGNLLWFMQFAQGFGEILRVCTDPAGNTYILGRPMANSIAFAGLPAIGFSYGDLFVAKFDPYGVPLWSRSFGSQNGEEHATGLAADAAGNVYITGYTNQGVSAAYTIHFGNGQSVYGKSFIVKLATDGTTIWARGVMAFIWDIAVSPSGDIALAGDLLSGGPLEIGGIPYPTPYNGMFVARLDSASNMVWHASSAGNASFSSAEIKEMAMDATGAVVAYGTSSGTVNIGGTVLTGHEDFMVKYSSTGSMLWVQQLPLSFGVTDMETDLNGDIYVCGSFSQTLTIQGNSYSSTTGAAIFLGKFDAAGAFKWGITGSRPSVSYENARAIVLDNMGSCYLVGDGGYTSQPVSSFVFGNYVSMEGTGLLYRISTNTNRLAGRIFYDLNSNGTKQASEPYAPGILVNALPLSFLGSSGSNGQYNVFVENGNYTISVVGGPPAYTAAPASHTGFFANTGSADTIRHFAMQPIPGMQDLQVAIATSVPPRPGFDFPVYVTYRNMGTTTVNATIEAALDPVLLIQNSSVAPSAQNGNTLTWNLPSLQPLQSATILINAQVPVNAPLGNMVSNLAQALPITNDIAPLNNTDSLNGVIIGSYDPNDKQVSKTWLSPNQIADGTWLDYTIRFQNTGTDTAFTVRIADTLSSMLNFTSFELLSSSHAATWEMRNDGSVMFRFNNILLPDSNTNEAASHGFVKYRIKPKTNLVLGDLIQNTAHIFFDFNEAIITNTAYTVVSLVASRPEIETNPLHIYPNPNKGKFTVQCSNIWQQQVTVELRNVLGQTVWQQSLPVENGELQQVISTSSLSKGVYYLQMKADNGSKVQKVVVE